MMINKVAVKTDKVRLFPGSYNISSGNSYVNYGENSTLTIKSPSGYTSTMDLKPTLTKAGASAIVKAVQTKLAACAETKDLTPSGCPNAIEPYSYQKVDKSSVEWTLDKDSVANLKPELDYRNPAIATVRVSPEYTFRATGTQFDRKTKFTQTLTSYSTIKTNVTQQPLKLTAS